MSGRLLGPPADTLLTAYCFHHDPQEVSNISAFFKNPRLNVASLQAGTRRPWGAQPIVQQAFPFANGFQVGKLESEETKGAGLPQEDGKVTGRENHVIEKGGAGARATDDKHGSGTGTCALLGVRLDGS